MYKKDKLGWVNFNPTHYKNEKFPNVIIYRINVPGVLYPWGVKSGKLSNDKNIFNFDGVINLQGITAGSYYKKIKI